MFALDLAGRGKYSSSVMKKLFAFILVALLAFSAASAKQEQSPKLFKPNDNVCFVGDSITHGGHYSENLVLYYITRFPESRMNFYNFGISGDSAGGILARMDDDIKPVKADIYTLMIGMNDVGRGKFSDTERVKPDHKDKVIKTRASYEKNLTKLTDILAANSRKLIIFTPSIYDQTSEGKTENLKGVNDELKVFGEIGGKLAKKHKAKVVDMWSYMSNVNEQLHKTDKSKSVISGDRVHPRDMGGYVMATKFIIDLNEPKIVSRTVLDSEKKKVVEAFNADLSNVKFVGGKVHFTSLEAALPYPTSKEKDDIDKILKFLPAYNKQILKVTNLRGGEYELKIDGNIVGSYSAKDLSAGVNLAENKKTPQYKQAQEVAKICSKYREKAGEYRGIRATEYFCKLRKYKTDEERVAACKESIASGKEKNPYVLGLMKKYEKLKPIQKEVGENVQKLIQQAYDAAQPKPHNFELYPIK